MRLARSNDIWRKLYKRQDFTIQSVQLHFEGVTALGQNTIELRKPLSLICGENGVGKTTLLRLFYRALSEWREDWDTLRRSFPASALSGKILSFGADARNRSGITRSYGSAKDLITDEDISSMPIEVVFVDTATLIPHLFRLLRADQNLSDLIEGISPRVLADDALDTVRQLVGRDYDKVEIFEISDYDEYERLPYFRVTVGDSSYCSESMGTGELALLHLFWVLEASSESSIIMLEEPESFVAPRSQRVLIDWIAEQALSKKLFVVISSHSGHIAERFPPDAITLCSRSGAITTVQPCPATHLLVERLNLLSYRRCLIFVEDAAAEAFASALIRNVQPRLHSECDIVAVGANSRITQALSAVPLVKSKRIVVMGLYDGDQRGRELPQMHWPVLHLPGEAGPERVIRNLCAQLDMEALARAIGVTEDAVRIALGGAEGADDHDWLSGVCAALERELGHVVRSLVPLWLPHNDVEVAAFSKALVEAARRPQ